MELEAIVHEGTAKLKKKDRLCKKDKCFLS